MLKKTSWTNASEIFRDLSMMQGEVPVQVEGTLGAEDRPPALSITEETEEEYFECSGGVIAEAPDLGLIQEMLNMVREKNLSSAEEFESIPVITKPSPETIKPEENLELETVSPNPVSPVKQNKEKKRRRNIAMESFIGKDITEKVIKLLKPEDIICKDHNRDLNVVECSVDKVNGWLSGNRQKELTLKKPALCLEPSTNMFKKKAKANLPIESPKVNPKPSKGGVKRDTQFVPSPYAEEYCKQLKEKLKLKETIQDDIWTKAEKQMKAIDQKRLLEIEAPLATTLEQSSPITVALTTTDVTTTDVTTTDVTTTDVTTTDITTTDVTTTDVTTTDVTTTDVTTIDVTTTDVTTTDVTTTDITLTETTKTAFPTTNITATDNQTTDVITTDFPTTDATTTDFPTTDVITTDVTTTVTTSGPTTTIDGRTADDEPNIDVITFGETATDEEGVPITFETSSSLPNKGFSNEKTLKTVHQIMEMLELPGHRHLLTDDCVICKAFEGFGYIYHC